MLLEPPWDDDEAGDDRPEGLVFDAMADFSPVPNTEDSWDHETPPANGVHDVETLVVTAANPSVSVLVTALIDGRPLSVELAPSVATMTEAELADEIMVMATTARMQALAAQHGIIAQYMTYLGSDPVGTRSFLEHDLGLPSPQSALRDKAELFASRYAARESE